jgi:hypothetical protein
MVSLPAMRHVVGERAQDKTAASVGQMGRFETEILTQQQNLFLTLRKVFGEIIDIVRGKLCFVNVQMGNVS